MTLSDKIRQLCRRMYADQFTGKAPELLALADEAEALERDAERYRWLRQASPMLLYAASHWTSKPQALDQMIDAALTKDKP